MDRRSRRLYRSSILFNHLCVVGWEISTPIDKYEGFRVVSGYADGLGRCLSVSLLLSLHTMGVVVMSTRTPAKLKSRSRRTNAQKPRQLWLGTRGTGNWLEWIACPGLPDEAPDAIMAHGDAFTVTPERSRRMAAWLLDYAAWVESRAK